MEKTVAYYIGYGEKGKENGNYYIVYYTGYRDHGNENGNYNLSP